MRGHRRLSLRTRMLVLLVGVTTIFLLIMGTVSTVVLANRVSTQFANNLIAEATRAPAELATSPQGYLAVEVTRLPLCIDPLTGGSRAARTATAALAAGIRQLIGERALSQYVRTGQTFALPVTAGGQRLRGAAHLSDAGTPGPRPVLVVAQPVSRAAGQVRGFIVAELITGGALIALLAIGGEWLIGRGLHPLDRMASAANEITSSGDLTARMPDSGDRTEVGTLGSAINTMLDRIQQAFSARLRSEQKVRQFAADASHELRTPLTTISGYAELYRQGALGPGQLPSAMRRIEQEAQRMSTLVAELLELARLDRTSSLDLTETDLASVVRDAVADAAAVEPQRPVRAQAPSRLVAIVDEPRIRQVLANLLGNVRAHTPVSTPVAVRLGQMSGGVLLEVADAGPGMSAEDAARAFDRFHRGAGQAGSGAAAAAAWACQSCRRSPRRMAGRRRWSPGLVTAPGSGSGCRCTRRPDRPGRRSAPESGGRG